MLLIYKEKTFKKYEIKDNKKAPHHRKMVRGFDWMLVNYSSLNFAESILIAMLTSLTTVDMMLSSATMLS